MRVLNPPELSKPLGFSHGVASRGEVVFVAGQIGCDQNGSIVSDSLVDQFDKALENALVVVKAAAGTPQDVARMTIYVVNKTDYKRCSREIGASYRRHMGRHFPAMSLVEVKSLFEDKAKVELELTAVIGAKERPRRSATRPVPRTRRNPARTKAPRVSK